MDDPTPGPAPESPEIEPPMDAPAPYPAPWIAPPSAPAPQRTAPPAERRNTISTGAVAFMSAVVGAVAVVGLLALLGLFSTETAETAAPASGPTSATVVQQVRTEIAGYEAAPDAVSYTHLRAHETVL